MTSADRRIWQKKKAAPDGQRPFHVLLSQFLALTSLELALRLVDHIDAALAAHDAAIAVALLERTEGVANLHGALPCLSRRADCALGCMTDQKSGEFWWTILGLNQ